MHGEASQPDSQADATAPGGRNVFRKEGHYWTVAYAGTVVRLKDAKGLHDIARLLTRPDCGVSAADLLASNRADAFGETAERARTTVTMRIRAALRRIDKEHPALGRHLAHAVRTGTVCRYDPEVSTSWSV